MKNKSNKGFVIILVLIIVILIGGFGYLYFTDKISLNLEDEKEVKEDNNIEDNASITTKEIQNIVNEAAKRVWKLSNGYPYCGENMTYEEEDAIFDENNISTHIASKDYTSLNAMKEDLGKYMSNELVEKYINAKEENTYIEKDGKLYCKVYHRGTSLYDEDHSSYEIDTITSDKVVVSGTIAYKNEGYAENEYESQNLKIELEKDDSNNFVITEYNIQ